MSSSMDDAGNRFVVAAPAALMEEEAAHAEFNISEKCVAKRLGPRFNSCGTLSLVVQFTQN